MKEPTGFLRIANGLIEFKPHEGRIDLKLGYAEINCDTIALPWAGELHAKGVALVIDDEGRFRQERNPDEAAQGVRGPRVTCWVCQDRTQKAIADLCGVVLVTGQDRNGELCAARASVLMSFVRSALLVAPAGLYIPAAESSMTIVSFDDPEAFLRYWRRQ